MVALASICPLIDEEPCANFLRGGTGLGLGLGLFI